MQSPWLDNLRIGAAGNLMQRPIIGFGIDDDGDPIAILSCGHPQHVRHQPPFVNRPWVITEAGRRSKLGERLNCVRCERFELPDGLVARERSPVFTESTLPPEQSREGSTPAGVWGRIVVIEGRLRYRVPSLERDSELHDGLPGIIVPEAAYSVEPLGSVRFFVEYFGPESKS